MNWARLRSDGQAHLLGDKFLEVVFQLDTPRTRSSRQAFFYFRA